MNESHDDTLRTPVEGPEPAKSADELLSHGLLTFIHNDPPAETERRMKSVMRRIADEADGRTARQGLRLVFPHARRWIALAACFVIAAGLVYLGMPTESKAQAAVRTAAAGLREPGNDRRFDVRIQPRGSNEFLAAPVGTIDSRGADLMLMRLQPEEGVWVTIGRDSEGPWIVHPDGRTERNPPPGAMPRWGVVENQPVTPESVDRVLEQLASGYSLEQTTETDKGGGTSLDHITGTRRPGSGPGAPRVELWLDSKTHAVKKVELMFPDPPPPPPGMPGGPGGPGSGRGRGGPDGMRGPDGPRGSGEHGGGERGGGERGHRPPRGPDGEDDVLMDSDGPDGPPPMRGGNPPPPPRDGPGGEGRGPGGPGAIGRVFRGGPFRVEFRPAPPPAPLPPEWFTPKGHTKPL